MLLNTLRLYLKSLHRDIWNVDGSRWKWTIMLIRNALCHLLKLKKSKTAGTEKEKCQRRKRLVHRWVWESELWQAHHRANHAGIRWRTSLEVCFFQPSPFLVFTKAISVKTRTYTESSKGLWGQEKIVFYAKYIFIDEKEFQ